MAVCLTVYLNIVIEQIVPCEFDKLKRKLLFVFSFVICFSSTFFFLFFFCIDSLMIRVDSEINLNLSALLKCEIRWAERSDHHRHKADCFVIKIDIRRIRKNVINLYI